VRETSVADEWRERFDNAELNALHGGRTAWPSRNALSERSWPFIVSAMATRIESRLTRRPLLRGVLHQGAFFVAVGVAPWLILAADGARRRLVAAIFAGSVAACFGTSALYHRVTWTPKLRLLMRRADHAGVYLLIAGTYTPVSVLVLQGAWRPAILTIVWSGAFAAIVLKFVWVTAPEWLAAAIGIALGWVAVVALPQLVARLNPAAVILLVVGGLAYTAGGVIYARRRPDPVPAVFGYHELFHALTIVAVACQYVAIAFFVVRVG
jgi:hemolysin III